MNLNNVISEGVGREIKDVLKLCSRQGCTKPKYLKNHTNDYTYTVCEEHLFKLKLEAMERLHADQ